jgi:hypothetical protein
MNSPIGIARHVVSLSIVALLVLLMEVMPHTLGRASVEDGLFESLTALAFAVAAVAFGVAAMRAPALRGSGAVWAPAITACWALLMFLCFGEEISWGQRIFDIPTPDFVAEVNTQGEINLHNIGEVNQFLGGTYRWMSIYLIMTGLGIPLFALTVWGKRIFGFFYFPVSPWCYSVVFIGAYIFGIYYRVWFPVPELQPPNTPTEIREFLLGLGSALFALHTMIWPQEVFLQRESGK